MKYKAVTTGQPGRQPAKSLLGEMHFLEMEMEMEMVFNGYSLTGFSITIYNNIIIINTKILMYNK